MKILKKNWFITLLGVLGLAILIWFGGPYLAIADKEILAPDWVRMILVVMLFCAWGLNNLRTSQLARQADIQLSKKLTEGAERQLSSSNDDEMSEVNYRFRAAIERLRLVNGKKSFFTKNYLYELPWYLLIGPPGAGKTTALINSGLDFPLEDTHGKTSVSGVGGTRYCDWWFTDQAILIDTAGRYTTQESQGIGDAEAWNGFVELLRRYRKRRPINGVFVALGTEVLLGQSDQELISNINSIRLRLSELKKQLGVSFPVYFLITKCDLLPGFNAYFSKMGKEERAQVWGMTYQQTDHKNLEYCAVFDNEYEGLLKRLSDNVLAKFHGERDPKRRAEILDFPNQFQRLRAPLNQAIGQLISTSRYHDDCWLRGVYFTSGTQEGVGLQKMMQNVAGPMGFGQQQLIMGKVQGKSYFIRDFFHKIVFNETELVGGNSRYESILRAARISGYCMTLVVSITAAMFWSTSYGLNDNRLTDLDNKIAEYVQVEAISDASDLPSEVADRLHHLNVIESIYNPGEDNWSLRMGLYQGNEITESLAQERTKQLLLFHQALQNQLASMLRENQDKSDYLHYALKAYLMFSSPEHLDKEYIQNWMLADWKNRYITEPEILKNLQQTLIELIPMAWPALESDSELVETSRGVLRDLPLARQIYHSIQDKANSESTMDFHLETFIGSKINYVFDGDFVKVPWLYTLDGYHEFFKPQQQQIIDELAEDSWVIGVRNQEMSDSELANLQAALEKRYLNDYIGHWQSVLNRLKLVPTASIDDDLQLLSAMLSGGNLLQQILEVASNNTTLSKPLVNNSMDLTDDPALKSVVDQQLNQSMKAKRLARIASLAGKSRLASLPDVPATLVDRQFQELHELMLNAENSTGNFSNLSRLLTELQVYLEEIVHGGTADQTAFDFAKAHISSGRNDILRRLHLEAQHLPEPIKKWVIQIADNTWQHVLNGAYSHISKEYNSKVRAYYLKSIAGRYPLNKQSEVDVTLDDFNEFFRPGGIEDQFFTEYMASFIETGNERWSAKTVNGKSLPISRFTLTKFEQAQRIRKVFFSGGSDLVNTQFSLRPTYLDANINRFELSMLGRDLTYRHGPARYSEMTWPPERGEDKIVYQFEDHYGVTSGNEVTGVWALFRFFDAFPLASSSYNDRFTLTVEQQQRKAVYELQASSVLNPFSADLLGQYKLPASL